MADKSLHENNIVGEKVIFIDFYIVSGNTFFNKMVDDLNQFAFKRFLAKWNSSLEMITTKKWKYLRPDCLYQTEEMDAAIRVI